FPRLRDVRWTGQSVSKPATYASGSADFGPVDSGSFVWINWWALNGQRRQADAQDGQAFLDAGQLDVVPAYPFPRVPSEPPLLDLRGLTAAGVPVSAVRSVAQATGNAVGRFVVDEGVAAGFACAQPGEGQMQDRCAHFLAEPLSAAAGGQPREAG